MKEGKKERSIALKTSINEVIEEEAEMAYVIRRFSKIIMKQKVSQRRIPPAKQLLQMIFFINTAGPIT